MNQSVTGQNGVIVLGVNQHHFSMIVDVALIVVTIQTKQERKHMQNFVFKDYNEVDEILGFLIEKTKVGELQWEVVDKGDHIHRQFSCVNNGYDVVFTYGNVDGAVEITSENILSEGITVVRYELNEYWNKYAKQNISSAVGTLDYAGRMNNDRAKEMFKPNVLVELIINSIENHKKSILKNFKSTFFLK